MAIQGSIKSPESDELARPLQTLRHQLPEIFAAAAVQRRAAVSADVQELVDRLLMGDRAGAMASLPRRLDVRLAVHAAIPNLMLPALVESGQIRNAGAGRLISGRYLDGILGLPAVEWAAPVLIGNGLFRAPDGSFEAVRVVGVRRPRLAGGPWAFAAADERALLDLEAVTVDRLNLNKLGHSALEQAMEITNRRVRLRAITEGARGFPGTLVFASLDKVKDITRTPPGRYSALLVRFRKGADLATALAGLRAVLPECSVFGTAELSHLTRRYYFTNTGIGGSFGFATTIAMLIGVVLI